MSVARPGQRVFVQCLCAGLLLAVGGNALSLPGKRLLGHYDFGYAIRGDRRARPAQVFDDGAGKVYFQARPGEAMPAVFAGKSLQLLVTQPEGQYFTAHTEADEFVLALGAARASVRRGDAAMPETPVLDRAEPDAGRGARLLASADPGLPSGVDFGLAPSSSASSGVVAASFGGERGLASEASGTAERDEAGDGVEVLGAPSEAHRAMHEQPVVFPAGSAVLRPAVLSALSALAVRIGREAAVVVDGRNDAGAVDALARLRAEALRNALLARGVLAANIEIRDVASGSPSPAPGLGSGQVHTSAVRWATPSPPGAGFAPDVTPAFEVLPSDHDIAVSLGRWARASGYAVVWDVRWVAPVTGGLRLRAPSFLDAVGQVVAGLRAQGYPVKAQSSADRVVRFSATE